MKASFTRLMAMTMVAALAVPAALVAQENALSFKRTDATDSLIFAKARVPSPNEVPVPKFTLKTRDRAFMMTIGGQVNPIMGVDLKNNLYNTDAGINFVTQDIPVPSMPGHRSDFYINPLNTAITFQIVGLANTENQISAFIKLTTNGNTQGINLNKAYVTWRGITAGLKNTLMTDGDAAQPPTIDPEGPCGELITSVYEVSYQSKNYNGFQFAAGLDMPSYYAANGTYRGHDYPKFDGTTVDDVANVDNIIPDIPLWIQWGKDPMNRIRVSGMLRAFPYRDLRTNENRHAFGWGAMLSGNLNVWKPLIFYYQIAYGHGIGAYLQDIAGMPLSFIPEDGNPGHMKATPMMGVNFGFTYNINSKWQFNIMGSESRIWDVRDYVSSDCNYKYALYMATNVFYQMNNWLQWGLEYVWGRRVTWGSGDGRSAHDNRIQAQLMFTI